jgi:hypothetical protein|tara:strand:+ start:332 stop:505 length:174 start_codon:yes stop_codon:yes gene_type:complete
MKKFDVKIRVVQTYQMDIEAENKEDAGVVAIEDYNNGNCKNDEPETTISIDSCNEAN